ncbi:MAG: hypothetical protein KDI47_01125 [Gammaproteobacteria bacterium]|nr:hypothetical protein [Gammaproteobacteria bacterium]
MLPHFLPEIFTADTQTDGGIPNTANAKTVTVAFDPARTSTETLRTAIREICYKVE